MHTCAAPTRCQPLRAVPGLGDALVHQSAPCNASRGPPTRLAPVAASPQAPLVATALATAGAALERCPVTPEALSVPPPPPPLLQTLPILAVLAALTAGFGSNLLAHLAPAGAAAPRQKAE